MKAHSFTIMILTIGFGWLSTGCYTQMQLSYDLDRPTQVSENGYYSWDDDERTSSGYNWSSTKQTSNLTTARSVDPKMNPRAFR